MFWHSVCILNYSLPQPKPFVIVARHGLVWVDSDVTRFTRHIARATMIRLPFAESFLSKEISMMEAQAPLKNELQTSLQLFETCLETPLVPGELSSWSEQLATACCTAKEQWIQASQVEHPEQFKQIRKQDNEMGTRVQNMQEEDIQIACQFDAVCQDVANFHDRAPMMEGDEARFRPAMQDLVEAGLKLVIRIRTQEQAIKTWFLEAFDRDRGNAD